MLGLAAVVATLLRFRARACIVLACVAAMLCATANASALERVQPKTRVWDFSFAEPLNIRLNTLASAEQRPGFLSARAKPASGSPHAARGAPQLTVTFGRNANQIEHAFRHTDKLGLSRTAVQEAVQKHLPSVADKIPSGAPLNQVIELDVWKTDFSPLRRIPTAFQRIED